MVSLADLSVNTPSTQTSEAGSAGEEQKEEEANGFNRDLLDSPRNAGAASTVNKEEEFKVKEMQLDQSFHNVQ